MRFCFVLFFLLWETELAIVSCWLSKMEHTWDYRMRFAFVYVNVANEKNHMPGLEAGYWSPEL